MLSAILTRLAKIGLGPPTVQTGLLAGHREGHANRREELLTAQLVAGVGDRRRLAGILCDCINLFGGRRRGVLRRLHHCRGDGRVLSFSEVSMTGATSGAFLTFAMAAGLRLRFFA